MKKRRGYRPFGNIATGTERIANAKSLQDLIRKQFKGKSIK